MHLKNNNVKIKIFENVFNVSFYLRVKLFLIVSACLAFHFFLPGFGFASDKLSRPSIKDVLTGSDSFGDENAKRIEELVNNGRLTIEEVDERIIIRWRGPKKNELLGEHIKARAKAVKGFQLFKSKTRHSNFIPLADIPADSSGSYKYEDFDLTNDALYFYKIMLVDADGGLNEFIPQFPAQARDLKKPAMPAKLEIQNGDGFIKLSWKPYLKEDFSEYQLLRSNIIGGEHEVIARIREAGICVFVDSDVQNGGSFSYVMKIQDKGGNLSRQSIEVIGKPIDKKAPETPMNLKAEPRNNAILLSWEKSPDKDVELYKVYIHEGELKPRDKMKLLNKVPAKDLFRNNYEAAGLKNGKIYYFTVSAVDFSGNESAQAFEIKSSPVDFTPPKAPSYIKVSSFNKLNKIEWASVPDADGDLSGYRVYRKSSAFPKYIAVADTKNPKKSDNQIFLDRAKGSKSKLSEFYPTIYEYSDAGIYNGMAYNYYVVAYDKKGNESKPSEAADGIPRDKVPPEKIAGLKAFSMLGKTRITWKKNKADRDLLGYYIYRRAESESKYSLIAEIKDLSTAAVDDVNLALGVKYSYRVSAFDESLNESVASEEKSAVAKFPNQISFSRAYIKNYPYTYCFSVNLNDNSVCYVKSADHITWTGWSEKVKFEAPPNLGRMVKISVQKWLKGILIFSFNPETLDLYFVNSSDEKTFGTWQLLFNKIELPPNFGKRSFICFEKDESMLMAFAYNPITKSAYHNICRDMETFLRWAPCGLKMAAPPIDSDMTQYSMTSDDKGYYLYAFNLDDSEIMQSYSFDKKSWKNWYKFSKGLKKPSNLEKDSRAGD